jgi:hypothetical protein
MSKRDIFILTEVFAYIRKARLLYSDARKEKDINTSVRIAVEADNHIDKALEGIRSILDDVEEN